MLSFPTFACEPAHPPPPPASGRGEEALKSTLNVKPLQARPEEYISAALVDRMLAGENPLRVWRQYRGLTLAALGGQSGVLKSTISELENGKAQGKPATWRALADALAVMVDDILPAT